MTTSAKRVDTQMVIWFRREGGTEHKAVASNLSETGLFIVTDLEADVGARLDLRLALSRDMAPLEMKGEVKWIRRDGTMGEEHLPGGLGIEFVGGQELGIIQIRVRERIREIQAQIAVMLSDGRRQGQAKLSKEEREALESLITPPSLSDESE